MGEVLSCSSSSSSELFTTGLSCGLKGVASLALFLGFGLASSLLTLLSFCCLGDGEVQGPDIRPKALGLWPLFGLGDQLLLLLQPCLPAVLLRLIPLQVFCWVNLFSLSLVTLLGVWCLFQGFLQVEEVQGSMLTAEWPQGVLTYTSELTVSWDIWTVMSTSPQLVLFQEADTSGPWIAGRGVRLLQFLYVFPWAMLQNILNQCYLELLPLCLVFALDFFLGQGPSACYFNFRGIPCISLFYHYIEFYRFVGHNGPNFDFIPKRDIYIFRQINSFAIHI